MGGTVEAPGPSSLPLPRNPPNASAVTSKLVSISSEFRSLFGARAQEGWRRLRWVGMRRRLSASEWQIEPQLMQSSRPQTPDLEKGLRSRALQGGGRSATGGGRSPRLAQASRHLRPGTLWERQLGARRGYSNNSMPVNYSKHGASKGRAIRNGRSLPTRPDRDPWTLSGWPPRFNLERSRSPGRCDRSRINLEAKLAPASRAMQKKGRLLVWVRSVGPRDLEHAD